MGRVDRNGGGAVDTETTQRSEEAGRKLSGKQHPAYKSALHRHL